MRNISPAVLADARKLRDTVVELGRTCCLRDPISSTCEAHQLTPPQVHTLMWLGEDGPLSMGDLARRIGITEKTMTGVIDRLERNGHVERARGESDRRVVRVRLTRKGAATQGRLHEKLEGSIAELLSYVEPADRGALIRIFERITERLAEIAKGRRASFAARRGGPARGLR